MLQVAGRGGPKTPACCVLECFDGLIILKAEIHLAITAQNRSAKSSGNADHEVGSATTSDVVSPAAGDTASGERSSAVAGSTETGV